MTSFPVPPKYVKCSIDWSQTYPESLVYRASKKAWGMVNEFGGWIQSGYDLELPHKGLKFVIPDEGNAALFKLKYL